MAFALLAAVLFAAACNLDTVILSMGYAVKGVRVSPVPQPDYRRPHHPDHPGPPCSWGPGPPGCSAGRAQPAGRLVLVGIGAVVR